MKHLYTFFLALLTSAALAQNPGDLDLSFDDDGILTTTFSSDIDGETDVLVQPDGKLLVSSSNYAPDGVLVMRLEIDGSYDDGFGTNGIANIDNISRTPAMTLQPDGKILLAGSYNNVGLVIRLNADGTPDVDFGDGGYVFVETINSQDGLLEIAVADDGTIVACGTTSTDAFTTSNALVVRLNADGSHDSFFDEDGIVIIDHNTYDNYADLHILPDNKILLIGTSLSYNDPVTGKMAMARLNADGSPDTDYATGGFYEETVDNLFTIGLAMIGYDDGTMMALTAVENSGGPGELYDFILVKLDVNGVPDTDFNDDGFSRLDYTMDGGLTDNLMHDLVQQSDGDYVLAGRAWDNTFGEFGGYRMLTARVNADGTLDDDFGDGGYVRQEFDGWATSTSIALYDDGRILVCGGASADSSTNSGGQKIALVRYWNAPNPHVDELATLSLTVYPNPCNGQLMISSDESIAMLQIYSATGALVKNIVVNGAVLRNKILDVSELSSGMYVLSSRENGAVRFMKE